MLRVGLFRGRGLISAAIRWQTWSEYSHAALVLPDLRIIEAWQGFGAGVRLTSLENWEGVRFFGVQGLTPSQSAVAHRWAEAQCGKPYDYLGVLRFMSRRTSSANHRWFCSELVFEAFMRAGLPLLARTPSSRVSPGLLSRSPLLVPL